MQLPRFDLTNIQGMFEYERTYVNPKTTYRIIKF